jgi:hypothetical protein
LPLKGEGIRIARLAYEHADIIGLTIFRELVGTVELTSEFEMIPVYLLTYR